MVAEEYVRIPNKMVDEVCKCVILVLSISYFAAQSSVPQRYILLIQLCCRSLVREKLRKHIVLHVVLCLLSLCKHRYSVDTYFCQYLQVLKQLCTEKIYYTELGFIFIPEGIPENPFLILPSVNFISFHYVQLQQPIPM